jgi:hypothetical protein
MQAPKNYFTMNNTINKIVSFITPKKSLNETTQKELQEIIQQNPYFAPAQLVYAAKLKQDKSFQLKTQVQKAGLFFTNSRWLQYQLLEVEVMENKVEPTIQANETTVLKNSIVIENNSFVAAKELEELSIIVEEPIKNSIEEKVDSTANSFIPNITIPSVVEVKNILESIDFSVKDDVVTDELIVAEPIESTTEETIVLENVVKEIVVSEPLVNEIEQPKAIEKEEAPEFVNDIHAEIAALKANWAKTHSNEYLEEINKPNEEPIAPIVEEKVEVIKPVALDNQNFISQNISNSLSAFKDTLKKPAESFETEKLSFETEPYYTIDYFESLGIKFDYTKEPTDKLTSKMLKFTDWLKKMKNNQYVPEVKEDPELDKAIQNIASASNVSKETVTETMAEVFAKQGKKEQAIQLYIKLSFLIPAKSTYFANQIKELKGI